MSISIVITMRVLSYINWTKEDVIDLENFYRFTNFVYYDFHTNF